MGWHRHAPYQRWRYLRHCKVPTRQPVYAVDRLRLRYGAHVRQPHLPPDEQRPVRRRYYRGPDGPRHEAFGLLLERGRRPAPGRPANRVPAEPGLERAAPAGRLRGLRALFSLTVCRPSFRLRRVPPMDRYVHVRCPRPGRPSEEAPRA